MINFSFFFIEFSEMYRNILFLLKAIWLRLCREFNFVVPAMRCIVMSLQYFNVFYSKCVYDKLYIYQPTYKSIIDGYIPLR